MTRLAQEEWGRYTKVCVLTCRTVQQGLLLSSSCTMTCQTMPWMRNPAGTLHGGLCATILDQAMGFVSYCLKAGEGTAPAVHLSVDYHRPLRPGERVKVTVRVVSVTRNLMNLTAEACQESHPEKICLSGSGVYFFKKTPDCFENE